MSLACTQGHRLSGKMLKTMAGALFNAFTANYARDANSRVHSKRTMAVGADGHRNPNSDKRKKRTGEKK